jgi:predicted small metal-binding protein
MPTKVLLGETVGEHRWRKYAEAVVSVQGKRGYGGELSGTVNAGGAFPSDAALGRSHWEVATMKSMTCRQLGGACDQKLSAQTWDEMVKVMTKHVMEKHPDVAKAMEKTHKEDPKKWGKEMKPKWDAAPEV